MQVQEYEGYFNNGNFFTAGRTIRIPENKRVFITVLDEPAKAGDKGISERLKQFDTIIEAINAAADEEMPPIEPIRLREVEL